MFEFLFKFWHTSFSIHLAHFTAFPLPNSRSKCCSRHYTNLISIRLRIVKTKLNPVSPVPQRIDRIPPRTLSKLSSERASRVTSLFPSHQSSTSRTRNPAKYNWLFSSSGAAARAPPSRTALQRNFLYEMHAPFYNIYSPARSLRVKKKKRAPRVAAAAMHGSASLLSLCSSSIYIGRRFIDSAAGPYCNACSTFRFV